MFVVKKLFIPLFIIILTVILFRVFRVVPVSKLIKNYDVMYVTKNFETKKVIQLLKENNVENFICLDNQKIPLNISEKTPEIALAKSNLTKSLYLKNRDSFFFDKNKNFNIFYIPDDFSRQAEKTVSELNHEGFPAGLNASSSFPIVAVLSVLAFSLFLIYLSENKLLLSLLSVLPVLFSIMMPFTTISASLCLFELVLFISIRLYDREGACKKLISNIMLCSLTAFSFLTVFLTKIQAGLLFIILICAELSVLMLYKSAQDFIDGIYSFRPVKIRSANVISLITRKNKVSFLICSLSVTIIFISALLSVNISSSSKNVKNIQLPSSNASVAYLPGLEEFIEWKWETLTFPYISLNNKNKANDSVNFKNYAEKKGFISESLNYISYNNDFKSNAIKEIEALNYPALEKMFILQGKKSKFGFLSTGSQNCSLLMFVLLTILLSLPLIFYMNTNRWR